MSPATTSSQASVIVYSAPSDSRITLASYSTSVASILRASAISMKVAPKHATHAPAMSSSGMTPSRFAPGSVTSCR